MLESSAGTAVLAEPSSENRLSNQYAQLAELAGGFIHEIKNHLGTLGLNLQLLAEDFQIPQTQKERRAGQRIQKLQRQCQNLVDISNDFLRFARIQELNFSPVHLGRMIEEMVDFFTPTAKMANIDIKTFISGDLPSIPLDMELFKQALLNLMLNAEQAMPEGGNLTIQATIAHGGEKGNCSDNPGSWVVIQFIDSGRGIPPEIQNRIFEPFFSTKQGGTGLGLATCKRIVEAHDGHIQVESEVGRGTRFTLRLPVPACESSFPEK